MAITFNGSIILKIIVFAQWILTVWAAQSPLFLTTTGYCYMNFFILALGLFSLYSSHESTEPILNYLIANALSVVLDIIFVSIYYPRGWYRVYGNHDNGGDEFRFSVGMFILLLILKPFICAVLFRIYSDRGGTTGDFRIPGLPNFSTPSNNPNYENLDKPATANQPVETATPYTSFEA